MIHGVCSLFVLAIYLHNRVEGSIAWWCDQFVVRWNQSHQLDKKGCEDVCIVCETAQLLLLLFLRIISAMESANWMVIQEGVYRLKLRHGRCHSLGVMIVSVCARLCVCLCVCVCVCVCA